MRDKYDIPGPLPADPVMESAKKLSSKDIVSIASASTKHVRLFKPTIDIRKSLHIV